MQKKARDEMVKAFETELKELVRNLPESFMREELAMHLETHPTSANGYYTCDLLNPRRAGGGPQGSPCTGRRFPSQILPYQKSASLELSEIILALYAVGVSTWKISHFLEGFLWSFLLTPWIGPSSLFVEEKRRRNPCTLP
jgi:hypothetical protein